MTSRTETELAERITNAEAAHRRAQAAAEEKHRLRMTAAGSALAEATEAYDRTEYEADRALRSAADDADKARAAAIAAATVTFDDLARARHNEPAAVVKTSPSGVLELWVGRVKIGGVVNQGGVAFRVDGRGGATFVSDAVQARAALWALLDAELAVA